MLRAIERPWFRARFAAATRALRWWAVQRAAGGARGCVRRRGGSGTYVVRLVERRAGSDEGVGDAVVALPCGEDERRHAAL